MEPKKNQFKPREWTENTPGDYDEDGFFITPNGSFWDPDYVYFNREGYDSHQGYYDDNGVYVPGPRWDAYNQCYPDEFHDEFEDMFDDADEYNQGEDDGYGHYPDDDLLDEEKFLEVTQDMEKVKISNEDDDKMPLGISTISNQPKPQSQSLTQPKPQVKETPKEEKKELVATKPKSGLALLLEKKEAEEKKKAEKKQQQQPKVAK